MAENPQQLQEQKFLNKSICNLLNFKLQIQKIIKFKIYSSQNRGDAVLQLSYMAWYHKCAIHFGIILLICEIKYPVYNRQKSEKEI